MKVIGILLTLIGYLTIYLGHPNQAMLKTPLSARCTYLGLVLSGIGLAVLVYMLPLLVAIFAWFAIAILVGSFIPFLPFFKRYITDEQQK